MMALTKTVTLSFERIWAGEEGEGGATHLLWRDREVLHPHVDHLPGRE
jgi:hypothetical protein